MGYKKHTLRLWLAHHHEAVLLVPLVSWLTPANHGEGGFLVPSMKYLWQRWSWCPRFVVGDFGYVAAPAKRCCRQQWDTAVLTHRREDQRLVPPFEDETRVCCPQGQGLRWLGYDPQAQAHWFGVRQPATLCACCWEASSCPREFVYPAKTQETLLGRLPLSTRAAQTLLRGVRPWIEASQSFEKNQLGLNQIFFNSLRLAWYMGLLADAACLLRAHALLGQPKPCKALLAELAPRQMTLDLP
ncbi:MAG TPA: hypothetical protein VGI71_07330 [Scandinavium sp.]